MRFAQGYPRVRLELACGCKEVDESPGMTAVFECGENGDHKGDDSGGPRSLAMARNAIETFGITNVANGGGVARLEQGTANECEELRMTIRMLDDNMKVIQGKKNVKAWDGANLARRVRQALRESE